ncbi:MAG TPA: hypothetical protein VIF09_10145 [Polyangiaceae bacterium]
MGFTSRVGWSLALAGVVATIACSSRAPSGPELTGRTSSAVFTNGGFETGTAAQPPPAPWSVQTFINPGITAQTPQTLAGLNLAAGGVARTTILNSLLGPGTQPDAHLGLTASLRWPRYGNQCAIVNDSGNNQDVNTLTQSMTVAAGDVDPADGLVHFRFTYAPVLQNPAHTAVEQPYYFVQVTDTTTGAILFTDFNLSADTTLAWSKVNAGTGNEIDYTDWQLVDVVGTGVAVGDTVTAEFIAAGCSLGGHYGQLYVDGVGTVIPGISIEGTAPAQVNPGADLTYTLIYRNGAATGETGVTATFTLPPGTTFVSDTLPAGVTCTTPAVGAGGSVVCTIGALGAGASGTFSITVAVGAAATGTIVESSYDISSTQELPLYGPPIVTQIGCTLDAQCPGGDWCDVSGNACMPKLANGQPVPTDSGHTNPTLNGTCTVAAGALVCVSAVCDTKDNDCGYANGDGPCTASTGATVCRSGACSSNGKCEPSGGCNVDADCTGGNWCDETTNVCTPPVANGGAVPTDAAHTNPTLDGTCTAAAGTLTCVSKVCDTKDNKCGYANGDGTCTVATGGTVCRSGTCSSSGVCEAPGSCNVDADCTGGNWCDESTHTCTPPVANGGAVPTDGAHTNPTLNGTCTPAAGALTCVSKVCDTKDNDCGYANGDGPCTAATGATVCRSKTCSSNGECMPAGGCNVDADCTTSSAPHCNTGSHTCVAGATDGGVAEAGGGDAAAGTDAGGHDAGGVDASSGLDATASPDGAAAPEGGAGANADVDGTGYAAGGGISCAAAPGSPDRGDALFWLGSLGLVLAVRRRRPAAT